MKEIGTITAYAEGLNRKISLKFMVRNCDKSFPWV